ncbi:MAG: hypothetical protein ABI134_04905 [Byssovorax sp.]
MSTFELVVEQVRAVAGADFAFVLTRRGRLVTRDAPRDMPEAGRTAIMDAARPLERGAVGELTLPREELVPYGGAAPIDVHFGVAADQAILCVVMSSWARKAMVTQALTDGVAKIEAVIAASGREPTRRRKSVAPPSMGRSTAGLVVASGATTHAARSLERPPVIQSQRPPPRPNRGSLPQITVGTAELGRESLAALEREARGERLSVPRLPSAPEISVDEGTLGRDSLAVIDNEVRGRRRGSAPLISLGEASLGRDSLAAIRRELGEEPRDSLPEISVEEGTLGRDSLAAIDGEVRGKRRGSAPLISLGEASLGRESLAAIDEDEERPSGVRLAIRPTTTSMPDTMRVELESLGDLEVPSSRSPAARRRTHPWVEQPEDAKRSLDAERVGRKISPPKVTLKLEDADTDVFEAARLDPIELPRAPTVKRRK